jgi:Uma2 family endonuclease
MSIATLEKPKNRRRNGALLSPDPPLLLNGDHLTLPEFERRYGAMPEIKKAELIEGIVVMSPPISNTHGEAHGTITYLLKSYAQATPRVSCSSNASVRLDGKNEYQPDALLRIQSGKLSRSKVGPDGLLEGAPQFVAEIAVSSAAYDLHEKKAVYQRCLVPEYFVWQIMDSQIHWFALEQGDYLELKPRSDGVIRSRVFPGLWLDVRALLTGDEARVSRTLERGIKSAEHARFVKRLAAGK